MDQDARRAAATLVVLAALGSVVRMAALGPEPAGEVAYRQAAAARPALDSVAQRAAAAARPLAAGERIDVNTADASALTRLPRVGPGLAARILAHRAEAGPFRTLEDLTAVPGIGPAVRDAVRPHVDLPAGGRPGGSHDSGVIDLNRAGVAELERLPGIGPARARAILDLRVARGRFRRIEELLEVRGIGPATLERLRGLVRIS